MPWLKLCPDCPGSRGLAEVVPAHNPWPVSDSLEVFTTGTGDIRKGVRCALGGGYQHIHQGESSKVKRTNNSHSRPLGLLLAPGSRGRRGQARGRPGRRPGASWSSTSRWMISCSQNVYYDENALWRTEDAVLLTPFVQDHVKRTMEKGLYTLEDGELIPEPTLSDKGKVGEHNQLPRHTAFPFQANKLATKKGVKLSCSQCGTQFGKKSNLDLHMLMHKGEGGRLKKRAEKEKAWALFDFSHSLHYILWHQMNIDSLDALRIHHCCGLEIQYK